MTGLLGRRPILSDTEPAIMSHLSKSTDGATRPPGRLARVVDSAASHQVGDTSDRRACRPAASLGTVGCAVCGIKPVHRDEA